LQRAWGMDVRHAGDGRPVAHHYVRAHRTSSPRLVTCNLGPITEHGGCSNILGQFMVACFRSFVANSNTAPRLIQTADSRRDGSDLLQKMNDHII
jgi:hypothetical protein